jgi:hypothetical protein
MRRRIALIALPALWAVACGPPKPLQYSFTNPTGGQNIGVNGATTTAGNDNAPDGSFPDAGLGGYFSDAGLPAGECAGDPDGTATGPKADLVVSELGLSTAPGFVEFYNRGTFTADLASTYTFQGVLANGSFPPETIDPGNLGLVAATLPANGEIGILLGSQLVFYVCWGQVSVSTLQATAVAQGLWAATGSCPQVPSPGYSLHLRGAGTQIPDWQSGLPSPFGCATTP